MRGRKMLAFFVAVLMVCSSMSLPSLANDAVHGIPEDSWSTAALTAAVDNGLLVGDATGHIQPQKNITRAEASAVINRAFGAVAGTPIDSDAWYAADMGKAIQMGTIDPGDLRPTEAATREEVFSMLGRAMKVSEQYGGATGSLSEFSDADAISGDKRADIAGMISAGYVKGSMDNESGAWRLSPKSLITREEFAQVMYSTIQSYVGGSRVTKVRSGNVMVREAGVTLDGADIQGDLIIGDGVGEGDVTIKDTTISGRVLIRGGGRNTIFLMNSTVGNGVYLGKKGGNLRLKSEGGKLAHTYIVADGANTVALDGSFGDVTVSGKVPLVLEGGSFDSAQVNAGQASVTVNGGAHLGAATLQGSNTQLNVASGTVDSITASGVGTRMKVDAGGTVTQVTANGENAVVYGEGKVNAVTINANDSGVYTGQTTVKVASGASNTTVGDHKVTGGKEEKTTQAVAPSASVIASTPQSTASTATNNTTNTTSTSNKGMTSGDDKSNSSSSSDRVTVTDIKVIDEDCFSFKASAHIDYIIVDDEDVHMSGKTLPYAVSSGSSGTVTWTVYLRDYLDEDAKSLEVGRDDYKDYTNKSALKFLWPTGISVSPSALSLNIGGTGGKLTATVRPSGASNSEVEWRSGNTAVATVDSNGRVMPVGLGTTTITANTLYGGYSASSSVTVKQTGQVKVSKIDVSTDPAKMTYAVGEALDLTGMEVLLTYDNGTQAVSPVELFSDYRLTLTPAGGTVLSAAHNGQAITVTHKDGYTAQTTGKLNVGGVVQTELLIKEQPSQLVYQVGDALDLSGLVVTLHQSGSAAMDIAYADFGSYGLTASPANGTTLTAAQNGSAIVVTHGASGKTASTSALSVTAGPAPVSGVRINKTATTIAVNGTETLVAAVIPAGAVNQGVSWSSDDPATVTVSSSGVITGIAEGATTITVTTDEGGFSAECRVTVAPTTVSSVQIKTQPTKLVYTEGEALDLSGLVATLNYSDSTSKDVAYADFFIDGLTATPDNGTTLSMVNNASPVVVKHTATNKMAATSNLTVNAKAVTNMVLNNPPAEMSYTEGQTLDLMGMEVILIYEDSDTEQISSQNFANRGITVSPAEGTTLSVSAHDGQSVVATHTASGKTVNAGNLTVVARTISSISVLTQPTKLSYIEGETLNLDGLVVRAYYADSADTTDIPFADFGDFGITADPADASVLSLSDNGNPVTLVHEESACTIYTDNLTVAAVGASGLSVETQPKLSYVENETLDLSDLVVKVQYTNGTSETVEYTEFSAKGLTATPNDGYILTVGDDGQPVVIEHTASDKTVNTNNLSVAAKEVSALAVVTQPTTSYAAGDLLDLSALVVKITYEDSTTKDVPFEEFSDRGLTANPADGTQMTVASHNGQPVRITHTDSMETADTENLSVVAKTVTGMSVKTQPDELTYLEGDVLVLTGLVVTLTYDVGSPEDVTLDEFESKGLTTNPEEGELLSPAAHNNNPVGIFHNASGQQTATNNLTVAERTVIAMAAKEVFTKMQYTIGEPLDLTGMVVTLTYDNQTEKDVPLAEFAANGLVASPADGEAIEAEDNGQNVRITHTPTEIWMGVGTLSVMPAEDSITGFDVTSQPNNLAYADGDALDLSGLVVTLSFNDGTQEDIPYAEFASRDVTVHPMEGTTLTAANYNDETIQITHNPSNWRTETDPLWVSSTLALQFTPASPTLKEGSTAAIGAEVGSFVAAGVDGTPTFALVNVLGGADNDKFNINPSTGALTLNAAGVAAGAGEYQVEASVTDDTTSASIEGTVTIGVADIGYTLSVDSEGADPPITTTFVRLTFDAPVAGLTSEEVQFFDYNETGASVLGELELEADDNGENKRYIYKLKGEDITQEGEITIKVLREGIDNSAKTIRIHRALEYRTFDSLTQDGSEGVPTTTLTLTFKEELQGGGAELKDVTHFDRDSITVDGATAGSFTRISEGVYELGISNITVENGEEITVTLDKYGCVFAPDELSVTVYR